VGVVSGIIRGMAERVVLRPEQRKSVESAAGKSSEEARVSIADIFRELIGHLDLQRSVAALSDLERKKKWSKNDLALIEGLRSRIQGRRKDIEEEVASVFNLADTNKAQAKKEAIRLLDTYGEDISLVKGRKARRDLENLVKRMIDVHGELKASSTVREESAIRMLGVARSVEKVLRNGVSEREFTKRADTVEAGALGRAVKTGIEEALGEKVSKRDAREIKKSFRNLEGKEIENKSRNIRKLAKGKSGVEKRIKRAFGKKEGGYWAEFHKRIDEIVQVSTVGAGESGSVRLRGRDKQNLKVMSAWAREGAEALEELRKEVVLEGVDPVLLNAKHGVESLVKDGSKVIEKLRGDSRNRVLAVIEYIGLEDPRGKNKGIARIAEALLPGARKLSNPDIFVEAEKVYDNLKKWHDEFGEFQGAVQSARREAETLLLIGGSSEEESLLRLDMGLTAGGDSGAWNKMHQLVEAYEADGTPVLTKEGRDKIDFLRSHVTQKEMVMIGEREGRPTLEEMYAQNDFMTYHRGIEARGMRPTMRGAEAQFFEMQYEEMLKGGMSEVDARHEVQMQIEKKIEELINKIMRTQDGSREGVNQMTSWSLFDLFGSEFVSGGFRDLWQARLALYDVSVFAGGAESFDDWARIAAFMPKEFLYVLFDDDKLESIFSYTEDGEIVDFGLSFKEVLSGLERKVPGSNRSIRDIWMAEILGSEDMSQIDKNKRRFFVSLIGQRMGVDFEMVGDDYVVKASHKKRARLKLPDGRDVSIMNLVGLDDNGQVINKDHFMRQAGGDELKAEKLFQEFKSVDRWGDLGWYVNSALMFNHLTLRSVELERGGRKGKMWKYMPNVLRKIHGEAMKHYFHQKNMGMVHARDMVDSYWRSFISWRIRKDMMVGDLKNVVEEGGASWKEKRNKEEVGFDQFFYRVVHSEDWDRNERVSGSLRSIEDVRWLATAQGQTSESYREIVRQWHRVGGHNVFDWIPVLEKMGVRQDELDAYVGAGGSLIGDAGLKFFLEKYDMYALLSFRGVDHGSWKDFIKYSGKSNEAFNNFIPLTEHPANDEAIAKQGRHLESFVGQEGMEAFVTRYVNWSMLTRRKSLGYETKIARERKGIFGNKKVEKSEPWDVYERDSDGNITDTIDQREVDRALEMGYRVDLVDGRVYDSGGVMQYRTERKRWYEDFNPFRPTQWGSPMLARGLKEESWTEQKKILKQYLRNSTWSPERYTQENMRFQARLMFGANLEKLPKNVLEMFAGTLKDFWRHPWKVPLVFYTIPRGILVNLGVDLEIVTNFFSPLNKEISKIFQV